MRLEDRDHPPRPQRARRRDRRRDLGRVVRVVVHDGRALGGASQDLEAPARAPEGRQRRGRRGHVDARRPQRLERGRGVQGVVGPRDGQPHLGPSASAKRGAVGAQVRVGTPNVRAPGPASARTSGRSQTTCVPAAARNARKASSRSRARPRSCGGRARRSSRPRSPAPGAGTTRRTRRPRRRATRPPPGGVRARRPQLAADEVGRVGPPASSAWTSIEVVVVLPCGPATAMRRLRGDLGQELGARRSRSHGPGRRPLRVLVRDGRGHHELDVVPGGHVGRVVAHGHGHARGADAVERGARPAAVGAR